MSHTVEISNVTGKNYNLPLNLKDSKGNTYIKDFHIPAYALNHKLEFNSEEEYNKWAKIHEDYISGKESIIKVDKASGHSLEKQNKNIEKKYTDKVKADQSKIDNLDEDLYIKTEVEKLDKSQGKK